MDDKSKKTIIDYQSVELSPQEQEELNKPLKDESGLDPEDKEFLTDLINKIENKVIDMHSPEKLINKAFYDTLDEKAQGKADYEAFNMLATIRDIYNLWQAGDKETYQIQNMVHKIRLHKEKLENIGGDIFII